MAKGRLRRKIPELTEALTGAFDEHHARMARSILHRLQLVESAMLELHQVIAAACLPWEHEIPLLQTIPGVGEKVAQVLPRPAGTCPGSPPPRTRRRGPSARRRIMSQARSVLVRLG